MANKYWQNGVYSGPQQLASEELLALQQLAKVAQQQRNTAISSSRDPWALSARDELGAYGKAIGNYTKAYEAQKPSNAPDGYHYALVNGSWKLVRNNSILGPLLKSIGLPALAFGGAALLAPAAAGGAAGTGAFGTAGMAGAAGAAPALAGVAAPAAAAASGLAPTANLPGSVVGGAAAAGGKGALGGILGSTAGKIGAGALGVLGLLDARSQRGAQTDFLNSMLDLRKRQLALAEQDYAGRAPLRTAGNEGLMKLAAAMQQGGGVFRNRGATEPAGYIGR